MSVIVLLITAGGLVAGGFLGAFLWPLSPASSMTWRLPRFASCETTVSSRPCPLKDVKTHDYA